MTTRTTYPATLLILVTPSLNLMITHLLTITIGPLLLLHVIQIAPTHRRHLHRHKLLLHLRRLLLLSNPAHHQLPPLLLPITNPHRHMMTTTMMTMIGGTTSAVGSAP